jgi:phage repressor protein C with HTH and peptisase S24 domain
MTPEPATLGLVPEEFQSGFDGESRIRHSAPVVNLVAAGGPFLENFEINTIGRAYLPARIRAADKRLFFMLVKGHSMEPVVHSGNYCLMRLTVAGSRNGRTVLVENREIAQSAYTLKRYFRPPQVGDRKGVIKLVSFNPDVPDIEINENGESQDGRYAVVAELIEPVSSLDWVRNMYDDSTDDVPPDTDGFY